MATIYEKNNHRFTLLKSNGESIFLDSNLDFYDIRRVNEDNEDGFYYRLFINPSSFYLYHIKKGRFLMHENGATCTISNHAARFNKIENYSQNTKTFIAHLADSNSKCLIKDVESILVRGFRYIGIESSHNNTNGYSYSRPVQLHEQTEDGRFKNIFLIVRSLTMHGNRRIHTNMKSLHIWVSSLIMDISLFITHQQRVIL